MNQEARQRHLSYPVGYRRDDRKLVTLGEIVDDPAQLIAMENLSLEERVALVRKRWEAGEWRDLVHGIEGEVDLVRAIGALEAQDELGQYLLGRAAKSIEMSIEAVSAGGPS